MMCQYQCSWCGKSMGVKEIPANHMTLEMQLLTKISHGICHDCKNKVLDSINKVQTININCNQTDKN